MTRKFERTFEVRVPLARAWRAFTESEERSLWEADPFEIDARVGGAVRWVLPGIESRGEVVALEPQKLVRHLEHSGPHAGQEVAVQFEEAEGGTRITVTHTGFGDGAEFDDALESTSLGWSRAIADLIVYLETGVAPKRFFFPWIDAGLAFTTTPGGLRVFAVTPDGFGARAGLEPEDLVLTLAGQPIYVRAELQPILRAQSPGAVVAIEWLRGNARMAGEAPLLASPLG